MSTASAQEERTDISTVLTKGKDAVRFFLLSKKPETEFNFDVDLAQKNSEENPVFYVQYAHARATSVIKQSCLSEQELLVYFNNLSKKSFIGEKPEKFNKAENDLVLRVLGFPEVARCVTENFEPHQLIFYLQDLASDFHKFYNDSKILVERSRMRLAVVVSCSIARERRSPSSSLKLKNVIIAMSSSTMPPNHLGRSQLQTWYCSGLSLRLLLACLLEWTVRLRRPLRTQEAVQPCWTPSR